MLVDVDKYVPPTPFAKLPPSADLFYRVHILFSSSSSDSAHTNANITRARFLIVFVLEAYL